jgi:hypothetical protein
MHGENSVFVIASEEAVKVLGELKYIFIDGTLFSCWRQSSI